MNNNDDENDSFFPRHEGGSGRLRALLQGLEEKQEKLLEHPIYKEGFDDGYQKALINGMHEKQDMKALVRMLVNLYDDDNDCC